MSCEVPNQKVCSEDTWTCEITQKPSTSCTGLFLLLWGLSLKIPAGGPVGEKGYIECVCMLLVNWCYSVSTCMTHTIPKTFFLP